MNSKTEALLEKLRSYGSVVVALSGGVDSAVLAKAAALALGDKAVAVTAVSELLSERERHDAAECARLSGLRHILLDAEDLAVPGVVENGLERCYYCKRARFQKILQWAAEHHIQAVADGSNVDDNGDYRPGQKALRELQVASPLAECGFHKEEIRKQAQLWGLPVWDKPSAACLASRVAYGIPLTKERLCRIERAEAILHKILPGQLRVRDHGSLARIELMPEMFESFWRERENLTHSLKELGFTYVTLDLSGYRMGSQNESGLGAGLANR